MKPVLKTLTSTLLLFLTLQLCAQDEAKKDRKKYENYKERNISKTYPASGNNLTIENSFGDVTVTTWDKNEIKVDIHIDASSTDKDVAEKTFQRIDVKDKQEGKEISFVTNFEDKEKNSCKNCSSTMHIDYDIHMPATNGLTITNNFGATVIPDYSGPVSITSMYGSLTAGKLNKMDRLIVQFGKATLKNLSNADVTFGYSSINIDNLSGNNKIKMEFCPYSKIILDNSLTSLTLNNSYSSVHLQPAANFSASYDVSTSYGSFIDKTNAGIKRTDTPEKYGPDLDKHYEGGSGSAKVTIKSSFGNVMIGEGTKEDMKQIKEKKRVRS